MKRFISVFLLVGFVYLAYGLLVSMWAPHVFAPVISEPSNTLFYDYPGVINVHTTKSTGSGSYERVFSAAQTANLSYVVITDLNDFSPDLNRQGYYGNAVAFIGGEYSYLDMRVLNFDMESSEHLQSPGRAQIAFADILSHYNRDRSEGIFFLSRPASPGYKATGQYPIGIDGIELLNLKNVWQDRWIESKVSFIWNALLYPFNSNLAFLRLLADAGEKEMFFWDRLNQIHPTSAYFGSSAESKLRLPREMILRFPSYETLFSIARNHVLLRSELTGNNSQDRKKISEALRQGQFYMSLDLLQNPKGFECYLSTPKSPALPLGSITDFAENQELIVKLPGKPELPFETVIYKNGERIMSSTSPQTSYAIHSPGVYRSVVRVKIPLPWPERPRWISWIVTNPIYIR